ncbi:MAG TPA: hypothetical protein VI039_01665 [Solirubrobacterales bacterium]
MTAYVSAPLGGADVGGGKALCRQVREAVGDGFEEGDLRVEVTCLDAGDGEGGWTLAQVGANARRATEDSAAIAFIGEPAAARRQSRPIVEAAGIAELGGLGRRQAIATILAVSEEGGQSDPRQAVLDAVEG